MDSGSPIQLGSGTLTTVFSDGTGNIDPTGVYYSPLTPRKYKIIVDVNGNGMYDQGIDTLDDND